MRLRQSGNDRFAICIESIHLCNRLMPLRICRAPGRPYVESIRLRTGSVSLIERCRKRGGVGVAVQETDSAANVFGGRDADDCAQGGRPRYVGGGGTVAVTEKFRPRTSPVSPRRCAAGHRLYLGPRRERRGKKARRREDGIEIEPAGSGGVSRLERAMAGRSTEVGVGWTNA